MEEEREVGVMLSHIAKYHGGGESGKENLAILQSFKIISQSQKVMFAKLRKSVGGAGCGNGGGFCMVCHRIPK